MASALSLSLDAQVRHEIESVLRRHPLRLKRAIRYDVEDLSQAIQLELLEKRGRVVRRWDPARGLSLVGFVRLIARRYARRVLASGRGNPWRALPTSTESLETLAASSASPPGLDLESWLDAREALARLQRRLTPNAYRILIRLYADGSSVDDVAAAEGVSAAAIYASCSRARRIVRRLARST